MKKPACSTRFAGLRARNQSQLDELDGRRAHHWVESILAYLEWRSGKSWRPLSDRFHPEYRNYLEAGRVVRVAQLDWIPNALNQELGRPLLSSRSKRVG